MKRTLAQKEANGIDLDMFRLAGRLEELAKTFPPGRTRSRINELSDLIYDARHSVREHMHVEDREATK